MAKQHTYKCTGVGQYRNRRRRFESVKKIVVRGSDYKMLGKPAVLYRVNRSKTWIVTDAQNLRKRLQQYNCKVVR